MANNTRLSMPAEPGALIGPGRTLTVARWLWAGLALTALAVFLLSLPGYLNELQVAPAGRGPLSPAGARALAVASVVTSLGAVLLSLGLAALLYWRRRDDRVALLTSAMLLIYGVAWAGPVVRLDYFYPDAMVLANASAMLFKSGPLPLFLFVFPNGRFVPRWTRWLAFLCLPVTVFFSFFFLVTKTDHGFPWAVVLLLGIATFLLPAAGLGAQIYRYRRVSGPEARRQTRWVLFGLLLWMAGVIFSTVPYAIVTNRGPAALEPWWWPLLSTFWALWFNVLPLSLTIAVLRFRLWQIDPIINRTLLYGSLTASVVAVYVLIVGGLGVLFQAQSSLLISLLATGVVALLFQPLRQGLQQTLNRLFYGERDDPATVFSRLGERLESARAPEAVLPALVETVATTLKLPYVAVVWEDEVATAFGDPVPELLNLPLVYHGERVGQLLVGSRRGETFNRGERALLQGIARQAGPAVHAMRLTADLRRSRRRLVTAREEERRRLRRDLHDGLGPTLAAHTLAAGSARALLYEDPEMADRLLLGLEKGLEATLGEIRRLVYNLRPPDLDQLGLAGTIEATASKLRAELEIAVAVPPTLPPLPAAVEVAAYRIVQEALTNVVRHAGADRCAVHLLLDEKLTVTISDDGRGLALEQIDGSAGGVGLITMRERAEELGGRLQIESRGAGGTTIRACLPLDADAAGRRTSCGTAEKDNQEEIDDV